MYRLNQISSTNYLPATPAVAAPAVPAVPATTVELPATPPIPTAPATPAEACVVGTALLGVHELNKADNKSDNVMNLFIFSPLKQEYYPLIIEW